MAGYDYATLKNTVATYMPKAATDPDFIVMFPRAIEFSEQRLYRELDLLQTVYRDSGFTFTPNNRNVTLPSPSATTTTGIFITTSGFNVITPVATDPDNGTRNQLTPVTRDFLDLAWPSIVGASIPQFYAPITQTTFIVGPWPDAAYKLESIGTIRPAALSDTNTATFLTQNLPDLFFAGVMEAVTGFMRDYSSNADDPGAAVNWAAEYTKLFASANVEELRKRYAGPAWTSQQPTTVANPPRN